MPIHNFFARDPKGEVSPEVFARLGAFLQVEIHVPPAIGKVLSDDNRPIPPPVTGVAIVDTGATMTCVQESILRDQLQLQPIRTVKSGTASGQVTQNVYPARIVAANQGITMDLNAVAGVDLTGQTVATLPEPQTVIGLLGRNFLRYCVFIWNGPGGYWTITL